MKYSFFLLLGLLPAILQAQGDAGNSRSSSSNYDPLGRPLEQGSNYDIYGSYFFGDKYCFANIRAKDGKEYPAMKVKLDLFENVAVYKDEKGKEKTTTYPIDRISFYDCEDPSKNRTLITGMPPIDKQTESSFYVVLDSGHASLLKYIKVEYTDKANTYGSASIRRVYRQNEFYYAYVPGNGMVKIGKDNADVIAALGNKKDEVSAFITQNNIKARKEADLIKVFMYYNSLK